jgi:hypothetical protein
VNRYKHDFGPVLPPNGYWQAEEGGDDEHVVNLARTTLVFGEWAIAGKVLAELLGLVDGGQCLPPAGATAPGIAQAAPGDAGEGRPA